MSKTLTSEQLQITHTKKQRVIVPAVAGSGKTHTLCERINYLTSRGVAAEEILIVSFSKKAVDILQKRLGNNFDIQTFHAFGKTMASLDHSGSTRLRLLKPSESDELLCQAIKDRPKTCRRVRLGTGVRLRNENGRARLARFLDATQRDSAMMTRLTSEADSGFSDFASVLPQFVRILNRYGQLMRERHLIDYPGMLRQGFEALGHASLPYKYLFVDEYQDMNAAQVRLLNRLVDRIPNVMIFGDPGQAIFGFTGSQFHDIEGELTRRFVTMPLTHSFRLSHPTATLANAILRGQQITGDHNGRRPTLTNCKTAREQELAVVARVASLKASGVPGSDIVILARTKAQLRDIEQALRSAGHETSPLYLERLPVHTEHMLAVLKFMNRSVGNPSDNSHGGKRRLEQRLEKLAGVAVSRENLQKARRAFVAGTRAPSFSGRFVASRKLYTSLIRASNGPYRAVNIELGRWEALAQRFETARAMGRHIAELENEAAIAASTIHGAKGDEWEHVIVIGLTDGSLPFYREMKRGDIEEERRLLYVAITRARSRVYLFHAPYHHAPSGQSFEKPSRFLDATVKKTLLSTTG